MSRNAARQECSPHPTGDLDRLLDHLAPREDWICLDLGTGRGTTALRLAAVAGRVVAVDRSPGRAGEAVAAARDAGRERLAGCAAIAGWLPFPDRSFHAVACRFAAHHFHRLERAVSEISRVLKDGGRLALVDGLAPESPALEAFLNTAYRLRDQHRFHGFRTAAAWHTLLADQGLAVEAVESWPEVHQFGEWLIRTGCEGPQKEAVLEHFYQAPAPARRHFAFTEEAGSLQTFTQKQGLLLARKS